MRFGRRPGALDLALFAATALLLAIVTARQIARSRPATDFLPNPAAIVADIAPARADMAPPLRGVAHAPSAVELADGRILAVWFEGAREAGPDVRLRRAALRDGVWTPGLDLMDAARASRETRRHVGTLGNPVLFRHTSGEYWLVFVSVGIGGWSGSALNLMRSADGETWGPARRLISSPFLNLSTLAKGPPLLLTDGVVALPAYHEMIGKFPELLFLSTDGRVIDKARMGAGGRGLIQPIAVALDGRRAVALMRGAGARAGVTWRSETRDAGQSWSRPKPIDLPNPTSPVAMLRLPNDRLGLVFNDDRRLRTLTRLARSQDEGVNWTRAGIVEDGRASGELHRYHWILADRAGRVHLFNSAYRDGGHTRAIRHRVFGVQAFESGEAGLVP